MSLSIKIGRIVNTEIKHHYFSIVMAKRLHLKSPYLVKRVKKSASSFLLFINSLYFSSVNNRRKTHVCSTHIISSEPIFLFQGLLLGMCSCHISLH